MNHFQQKLPGSNFPVLSCRIPLNPFLPHLRRPLPTVLYAARQTGRCILPVLNLTSSRAIECGLLRIYYNDMYFEVEKMK
ncbi:hypothetical protein I7I53_06706 [Histoplasma capsulatum var. duboisii H88]|uniref:Uncharacterized protein n=1 Tax=Ajellomyces capsulatus (strain H88) TaxID=544711 RepID=A0A8A1LET2_AJEC8|nr:hypothetical protein I7I53_06706 [Histoplasma capsulatum var. duboisii H88]